MGNPRVYKALRDELRAVLTELQRINSGECVGDEMIDTIQLINATLNGMKNE